MIQDAKLLLSGAISASDNSITGQTVTGTNTSVLSTNTVDLSTARDIGEGQDLYGRFQVSTAAAGGTSVEFQVVTADNAALSTNVTVIGSTGAIATAALTAGARFACGVNPRIANNGQRYVGLRYVIVGAMTAGVYVGDLGIEIQDGQKPYPSGFAIL
jgi:predicted RecA/RadA family phage recombinase